jgi:hypothetical protein
MNGAIIQEHACPRCAIRRTVSIASASFCFNCRLHWDKALDASEPRLEPPYTFTAAETARLMIYRAAIHAGFYSDHSETSPRGAPAVSGGRGACTGTACQRMSAANESVVDRQLSEWLAPQRR